MQRKRDKKEEQKHPDQPRKPKPGPQVKVDKTEYETKRQKLQEKIADAKENYRIHQSKATKKVLT